MTTPPPPATVNRPWWPWLVLALGLAWTAVIRIPLVLNAEDHLDSDLAVDGLTLLDATHGHWRWHYPGTPHMGILPVLASYPQAMLWGANPVTLVSGGTVLWCLVVASTFGLAWKAFGPRVAGWSLVPMVFSSMGTIWLSGRITGGHLLVLAWHASAFAGLHACLKRRTRRSAALLGAWCGLGLYIDAMFLVTIAGLATAAVFVWLEAGRPRSGFGLAAAFVVGLAVGAAPREIGRIVDLYDAYPSQFAATLDPSAVAGHSEILYRECLPRLIAGFGLQSASPTADGWALLLLAGFAAAIARLGLDAVREGDPARRAVVGGALLSAALVVAAFLLNRNIYDSDNYRYLVFLLVPWSLGFGLGLDDLWRLGVRGRVAAGLVAILLAAGMTSAAFRWYRETRHYLDGRGHPVRAPRPPWSELTVVPARSRSAAPKKPGPGRYAIPPDVTHLFGGYWDVYRLSFLSGGRIVGVPLPMYPNRFRGWSDGLGPGRGKIMIVRSIEESATTARPAAERRGGRRAPVRSARGIDWHPALTTAWKAEGRDPAEIDRLEVVVP